MAALAGHARALYLAGDLDAAWAAALRAAEHPDAGRRVPGHAFARSTLALVAAERGRPAAARRHADKAKALVSGVGSSRTWLGANASAAHAVVLAAEGRLAEAERELSGAERFFRDEVATVHHAWLLVVLADVRCRRGRLDDAAEAVRSAREVMDDLGDCGRIPALAAAVDAKLADAASRAASGEMLDPPSAAELAVLRLLATRPVDPGDRRRAVPLAEHGAHPHPRPLPQARRQLPRGRRRPRGRARLAGASEIT